MARKSLFATATCGVLLWLAFSPTAATGEAAAPKPVASDELINRLANGGIVYTFDDYEGFINLDVKGDCGSYVRLRARFDGLYVVPEPHLSWFIRQGVAVNPKHRDTYTIYPKRISVSAQARVVQRVLEDDGSIRRHLTNTLTWSFSSAYSLPVPPEAPKDPKEVNNISDWKRRVEQCRRDHKFLGSFQIVDRRAIGGDVKAGPHFSFFDRQGGRAHTLVDGIELSTGRTWHVSRTTGMARAHGVRSSFEQAVITGSATSSLDHANFYGLSDPNIHVTLAEFNFEKLSIRRAGAVEDEVPFYKTAHRPPTKKCLSDKRCTAQYAYFVGLKTKVDAALEPVATNEQDWKPGFDEVRLYRLTLNEPGPEQVEAVRFGLIGTSEHPGITTNAGNHYLASGPCLDCTIGRSAETRSRSVTIKDQTTTRTYQHYNECPIDSLPDCFFTDRDNPDFTLGDDKTDENLNYAVSQELKRDDVEDKEQTVRLCVKDTGASTKMYAEVLVNGWWYPAQAKGPTASSTGEELMIPLDKNTNDCADAWDQENGTSGGNDNGIDDKETGHNANYPGDGLTVFEEYRGLFCQGRHKRFSPQTTDLFVHDYTGQYKLQLEQVGAYYRTSGVDLHVVLADEFRDDVMNYQQTRHSLGNQYNVVVMRNYVKPSDVGYRDFQDQWLIFAGRAADYGPPRAEANTVIIQYEPLLRDADYDSARMVELIGHEIGHMIGCKHHGARDRFVTTSGLVLDGTAVRDDRHFVCCKGGEHSGSCSCFMRYNVAALFCNADAVKTPAERYKELYKVYQKSSARRTLFCNNQQGTDMNAGGNWCGDASVGVCRQQLRVRSYR